MARKLHLKISKRKWLKRPIIEIAKRGDFRSLLHTKSNGAYECTIAFLIAAGSVR